MAACARRMAAPFAELERMRDEFLAELLQLVERFGVAQLAQPEAQLAQPETQSMLPEARVY